jgi:phosphodiesterase/alkaline phosphatase D-like protein
MPARHIPTDIQRIREQRPVPLKWLTFPDHTARRIRWLARVWIVVAAAILVVMAFRGGIPQHPDRTDWDIYARIGLLVVVVVGALISWRWEGAGASLIVAGALGFGAIAALEFQPWRAFLVATVFLIPGVLFWLVWQRTKPLRSLGLLAVGLAIGLSVAGFSANRAYETYVGPVQPESRVVAQRAEFVTWIWAGGTTDSSVVIKASLGRDVADAQLLISTREDLADSRRVAAMPASSANATDLLGFAVDGLSPDTDYWYAVVADGTVDEARKGHIRTFPSGAASFTFAFGSCANTGSNGVVFDTIRETNPLFFLSLGDFHYENIGVNNPAVYRDAFDQNLTSPGQAALYRQTSFAYVWDDHDYGPNDSDSTAPGREAAQVNYRDVVPHYPLPGGENGGPIYQAFTVGRVRFIVTDNYSHRSPNAEPDGPGKTMLGADQKAWLKQELLDANGAYPVTVWVNSQPWIVAAEPTADGWGAFDTERREIATFIADNNITGLMMLSGDAHMLAIDDGSNNTFAPEGGASFPVFHAAALDRRGSMKGGPYSEGAYPSPGQFGLMTVNDDAGDSIEIIWSGRNHENEEIVGHRFTIDVPSATPPRPASALFAIAMAPPNAIRRRGWAFMGTLDGRSRCDPEDERPTWRNDAEPVAAGYIDCGDQPGHRNPPGGRYRRRSSR